MEIKSSKWGVATWITNEKKLQVFKCCNKRFVEDIKSSLKAIKFWKPEKSDGDIEKRNTAINVSTILQNDVMIRSLLDLVSIQSCRFFNNGRVPEKQRGSFVHRNSELLEISVDLWEKEQEKEYHERYRFVGTFKGLFETNKINRSRKATNTVIMTWKLWNMTLYILGECGHKKKLQYQIQGINKSPASDGRFETTNWRLFGNRPEKIAEEFAKPHNKYHLKIERP